MPGTPRHSILGWGPHPILPEFSLLLTPLKGERSPWEPEEVFLLISGIHFCAKSSKIMKEAELLFSVQKPNTLTFNHRWGWVAHFH